MLKISIVIYCMCVYATLNAFPHFNEIFTDDASIAKVLKKLDLFDIDDYNQYILNLEAIIEQSQQVALYAIEASVEIAEIAAQGLATLGAQQNILEINSIQSSYIKIFEANRHNAFLKTIDISSCVASAIAQLYDAFQSSNEEIATKLNNITIIFKNLTTVTYTEPAKSHLQLSYKIRGNIYECPFNFDDFTQFFLCLACKTVLKNIAILNEFAASFNDTSTKVEHLLSEFHDSIEFWKEQNVESFNNSAQFIYNDVFVPCANNLGYIN